MTPKNDVKLVHSVLISQSKQMISKLVLTHLGVSPKIILLILLFL